MTLADAAHKAGRSAAETYREEGVQQPPALSSAPFSLTQVLKGSGEQPTEAEMQTVSTEWSLGAQEAWAATERSSGNA